MIPLYLAITDPKLFGRHFQGDSWIRWRAFCLVLDGQRLTKLDREIAQHHTGRTVFPRTPFGEAVLVCGRRSAKSRMMAVGALIDAISFDHRKLAPGEVGTVPLIAADRKQARTLMRYVLGLAQSVPTIAAMIASEGAETLELNNRTVIEIHTASFRSTRGYTLISAYCDEVAFWRSQDDGANPADEILAALRPGLASTGGRLIIASSPYAKAGPLWSAYRRHFGKDSSPVLVWKGATGEMNPTIPARVIAARYEEDPASARAEYGAEFRDDVSGFLDRAVIEAAVEPGRIVRPKVDGTTYHAFADPSGGASDAFTLAIAHADGTAAVLDCLVERQPPFNPTDVVADIADVLRSYGLSEVIGDRYAAGWVVSSFAAVGIRYRHSERDRSGIYSDALPLFTSGRALLLDNPKLITQLAGLERRTSNAGRDRIDHGSGAHDDLANSAAGALVLAAGRSSFAPIVMPIDIIRSPAPHLASGPVYVSDQHMENTKWTMPT